MPKFRLGFAAVVVLLLGGCVGGPTQYETTPVNVQTAQGVVVCQLYTRERVIWDRSINRPASMSV